MECLICRNATTVAGTATVTLERHGLTLVVKGAPAQVCPNCGENYVDERVTAELLTTAEELAKSGAQVEIGQYIKAS